MREGRILPRSSQLAARSCSRGSTLLDAVVGSALMVVVFVGIVGAFRLTVQTVGNNASRAGAIALANERLEYIRSLSYNAIGTSGGIPSGDLEQEETLSLNNTTYTRRTFVSYEDDPGDGLGVNDDNDVVTDYKAVKTSVSWDSREGTRTITMAARVSPPGIEQAVPGGILSISVTNDADEPISDAEVEIVNTSISPSIDTTTYTGPDGYAVMLGVPPGAGYEIIVTKSGYTTSQTYDPTVENTNPVPAHLSVALDQTTPANFEIDLLSQLDVGTFEPLEESEWDDTFANSDELESTANVAVGAGTISLVSEEEAFVSEGSARSYDLAPDYLYAWDEASWDDSRPAGTDAVYHVFSDGTLVPDAVLPGNGAGFSTSPISLANVSTTTYPALALGVELSTSDSGATPSINEWAITYSVGPVPIPDIEFAMRGVKTIGSGPGGPVYKLDQTYFTDDEGSVSIQSLEYDAYTLSIAGNDYDISSSCAPQPTAVTPGDMVTAQLFLVPHTTHSLLVDVRGGSGALMTGVDVNLSRGAYDETVQTDACGNAFFSGLVASGETPYTLTVLSSTEDVEVDGTTRFSILLNE